MSEYRIMGVALRRGEQLWTIPRGSHDELLRHHKLSFDPRTDEKGFWITGGHYISRYQAAEMGLATGQVKRPMRELFSGDIDWDGRRPVKTSATRPKGEKRWLNKRRLF